ncbi:Fe-S cluster assembly ATPase SufC [bacterium]|nr:Fe-S cluster assembly ATPase SufC [bacterium]HPF36009.1 Fe-S cluster assembly ATPase SufC [Candidatus Krumholzibacteria bacterium]HRX51586.1 Fe-S cluster assembly ATPase SufC [Candidatus Krumholzibacteria bacterium]
MNAKTPVFSCRGVRVSVEGKEIVKGVDLDVMPGEKHALMGPNGSGKSTLAAALMGHPAYEVSGEILLRGERVDGLAPDERARMGMFLGFQYPVAVPGVTVASYLRAVLSARRGADVPVREFRKEMDAAFAELGVRKEFVTRYLNDGFSGGEKKRLEILQMLMLKPEFALLDETDSGLDIDALKVVSEGINKAHHADNGVLLVTHYQRILDYVKPDVVHVFMDGRIVRTGGFELAGELEAKGYDWLAPATVGAGEEATS